MNALSDFRWPTLVIAFFAAASAAIAQDPGALRAGAARETSILDRVNSTGNTSLSSSPQNFTNAGPVTPLAGEFDYGVQQIIVRRSNYEPWFFSVSGAFAYTTNAPLVNIHNADDIYYRAGIAGAYVPQISGNLFAAVSVSQNFYWYDQFRDVLDFADFNADVGLIYVTPKNAAPLLRDTAFFVRYHAERLTDVGDLGKSFFTDQLIEVGAQRTIPISRGFQLYTGVEADISMKSSVDGPRRDEFIGYFGGRLNWTDHFITTLDLRSAYYDYFKADRNDWNSIVSLSTEYKINEWASLGATVSWTFNVSNQDFFNYNAGTLAAIVNLSVRF